jgi:hypothetical protein
VDDSCTGGRLLLRARRPVGRLGRRAGAARSSDGDVRRRGWWDLTGRGAARAAGAWGRVRARYEHDTSTIRRYEHDTSGSGLDLRIDGHWASLDLFGQARAGSGRLGQARAGAILKNFQNPPFKTRRAARLWQATACRGRRRRGSSQALRGQAESLKQTYSQLVHSIPGLRRCPLPEETFLAPLHQQPVRTHDPGAREPDKQATPTFKFAKRS